jgi:RHS repeat-associated protein
MVVGIALLRKDSSRARRHVALLLVFALWCGASLPVSATTAEAGSHPLDAVARTIDRAMNAVGDAAYAYDGDGLRAAKTVSSATTEFTWDDGPLPRMLYDGTTNYVYGPDGNVLQTIAGGTTRWYHADQLGSTRALTDGSGTIVATFTHDTNGNQTESTGSVTIPFGWAGEYKDPETGFVYLRARYYDPATAQFLTRDPIVAHTRSAYGYVDNNPLNAIDPSGLFGWNDLKAAAGEIWRSPGAALSDAAKGFANFSAGIGNFGVSTISLGHWQIDAPYCGPGLGASHTIGYWTGQLELAIAGAKTPTRSTPSATEEGMAASQLERVGSALKDDPLHRAASWVVDDPAAQRFTITGGDGVQRSLYQLPGEVNGKPGVFEWIIDESSGQPVINHQRFIPGGDVTGYPNQRP